MTAVIAKANLDIPSAIHLFGDERLLALRPKAKRYTVKELCERAQIRNRATGGPQPIIFLWNKPHHGQTIRDNAQRVYAISSRSLPQCDPERSLRLLEILAHGFHDYAAREALCGRGFFVAEVSPDDGRAWLREIGRRGGRARTTKKALTSKANGRSKATTPLHSTLVKTH